MRTIRFHRAAAASPGKHGEKDWRVVLGNLAPEHSEVLFALGMMLLAEDRYDRPNQLGRYMLWQYVDLLLQARTPERVAEIAEDAHLAVEDSPRRRGQAA